jgi:hypothetical protein
MNQRECAYCEKEIKTMPYWDYDLSSWVCGKCKEHLDSQKTKK